MTLKLGGEVVKVVSRFLESEENKDTFVLGLQRIEKEDASLLELTNDKPIVLVNAYVNLGHLNVLCTLNSSLGSQNKISLPGGKQFEVDSNEISPRTRNDRFQELRVSKYLKDIADFYSAATGKPVNSTAQAILNYEFGEVSKSPSRSLTR